MSYPIIALKRHYTSPITVNLLDVSERANYFYSIAQKFQITVGSDERKVRYNSEGLSAGNPNKKMVMLKIQDMEKNGSKPVFLNVVSKFK